MRQFIFVSMGTDLKSLIKLIKLLYLLLNLFLLSKSPNKDRHGSMIVLTGACCDDLHNFNALSFSSTGEVLLNDIRVIN